MRTLFGFALTVATTFGCADDVRAQGANGAGGAPYPRGYAFKDESILSINRSYLGYSNFVYPGPDPPAPGYVTRSNAPTVQGYAPTPAPAPARRGLFGRRRGYRY